MVRPPNGCSARPSAIHHIHSPESSTPIRHAFAGRRFQEKRKEGISGPALSTSAGPIFEQYPEQEHRAIKRRVKAKQNFREFQAARRTIDGYEAMHMIRKGQARWISGNVRKQNQFIDKLFDLPA